MKAGSVDVCLDACSIIHMWRGMDPRQGLALLMNEVQRVLRPGGFFISVSDVAHQDSDEVRNDFPCKDASHP